MSANMDETVSVGYEAWADALRSDRILGVSCSDCGATYGTPISVCHDCGSRNLESVDLPTEGTLYSVTRVEVPPTGFEGPYHVGIVQVGAARVTARIETDADDAPPEIDDSVVFSGVMETDDGLPAPVFTTETS
ncbi:Zn-ribbon domain-containing OB-fold protein [Halocatena salina]|uniref:Zinc ribbon domain-containing protein n=1 Tax=Halocatena salina TaxID=2934340 RepID=A0A8U0A5E8_9EURY|nr:zinc ribbon domain-containing protein [Halocatena salina]UPM43698.1 zinc ribbon domain-containing protein [Halocatena salina]